MNAIILELAKEADLIQWDTLPSGAKTPDHESVVKATKFAELLIRECADLFDPDSTVEHEEWIVRKIILRHFGVKE